MLSYLEIQSATDIPAMDLNRNLQSLACVKGKNVLRKEPMSKEISETDVFHFNENFQSKLIKVDPLLSFGSCNLLLSLLVIACVSRHRYFLHISGLIINLEPFWFGCSIRVVGAQLLVAERPS